MTEATRNPSAGHQKLFQTVLDAASLRLEMLALERDRPGRVVYCVDTNVVELFLAPREMGPRSSPEVNQAESGKPLEPENRDSDHGGRGGGGYGAVFTNDTPETAEALGAALSRYLFFMQTSDDPLLLLPGHDAEVRGRYDALAREVGQQAGRLERPEHTVERRQKLRNILDELVKSGQNSPDDSFFASVHELLVGEQLSLEKLSRFNQLLRHNRLGRLSNHASKLAGQLSKAVGNENDIRKILEGPKYLDELFEEGIYRDQWKDRILEQNKSRRTYPLNADIYAMARLEWLNLRLQKYDISLVLLTGDEALHKAARKYIYNSYDEQTFGLKYLRHPRGYLNSKQIIATAQAELERPTSVYPSAGKGGVDFDVTWIDGLLARCYLGRNNAEDTKDGGGREAALIKLLKRDSHEHKQLMDFLQKYQFIEELERNIEKSWCDFSSMLISQHKAASQLAREEIKRTIGNRFTNEMEAVLAEVDRFIIQKNQENWQSFINSSADAGVMLSLNALQSGDHRNILSRNVPPLLHEKFVTATAFVRRALAQGEVNIAHELQRALPEIEKEDPFGYARMLAYATLHAFQGNWYVARVLADQAVAIAVGLVTKQIPEIAAAGSVKENQIRSVIAPLITGREAYYFCAVAYRNSARSPEELKHVRSLLEKSDGCLDFELTQNREADSDVRELSSVLRLRGYVEKLSVGVTELLFEVFSSENSTEIISEKNKNECLNLFREFCDVNQPVPNSLFEEADWIKCFVERQVTTNAMMLDAILFESGLSYDKYASYALYLRLLENVADGKCRKLLQETFLVKMVRFYADCRYMDKNKSNVRSLNTEMHKLLAELERRKNKLLMKYDYFRYKFLLTAAGKCLNGGL